MRKTILIVDDDPHELDLAGATLRRVPNSDEVVLTQIETRAKAAKLIASGRIAPAVVMVDLEIPGDGLDVFEFLEFLHDTETTHDTPIVVCSYGTVEYAMAQIESLTHYVHEFQHKEHDWEKDHQRWSRVVSLALRE